MLQVLGEQPYGAAADVWSVGVVLREAILRRPPYFELPVFRAMYLIRSQVPGPARNPFIHPRSAP
jgi:serine/threonine protein kinase